MSRELRIMVTGGGTGGHTIPALATVDAIKELVGKNHPDVTIKFLYVGSAHGLEARLAKEAGLNFVSISTGKLRRATNMLRMVSLANILDSIRVPIGFFQALSFVSMFRPDVVFSTGGYVSVPAVLAAALLRRPILMHEQTVQIGLANRWSARIARRIALSYAESTDELSAADREKTFVTGGIVRKTVLGGDVSRARKKYGFVGNLSELPVVYVTGGAQGSSLINKSVEEAMPVLLEKCCIIHQCGRQKVGVEQDEHRLIAAVAVLPLELHSRYVVTPFVGDEIGDVYAASSLVVGRSGAGTISEVSAVGRAAVLIPLVPTGGDEQTKNALRQQNVGAAVIIKQSELSGTVLADCVLSLLADPSRMVAMGEAALKLASPHAAERLAEEVVKLGLEQARRLAR